MRPLIRIAVLSVVAVMLLAVAGLFLIRSATGRDYVKDFFVHQIEQNIGRKLEVGMVRIVLFPGLHLDLRDVTIYEPDGQRVRRRGRELAERAHRVPAVSQRGVEIEHCFSVAPFNKLSTRGDVAIA